MSPPEQWKAEKVGRVSGQGCSCPHSDQLKLPRNSLLIKLFQKAAVLCHIIFHVGQSWKILCNGMYRREHLAQKPLPETRVRAGPGVIHEQVWHRTSHIICVSATLTSTALKKYPNNSMLWSTVGLGICKQQRDWVCLTLGSWSHLLVCNQSKLVTSFNYLIPSTSAPYRISSFTSKQFTQESCLYL